MSSSGTIGKINAGGNDYLVASTAFATCSTPSDTAAKVATIQDSASFTLIEGITIHVYFYNAVTVSDPTLNVNNTGAKPIVMDPNSSVGLVQPYSWKSGSVVSFTFYSDTWYMNDIRNDVFVINVTQDNQGNITVSQSADQLTQARTHEMVTLIAWTDIDSTIVTLAQPLYIFPIEVFVGVNFANLIDTNTMGASSTGRIGVYAVYWSTFGVSPAGIHFNYGVENSNNKVTSISQSSTNTEYPSAAAVYNYISGLLSGYVSDVTVDGTSVVNNGTAEITSQWYESSDGGVYRGKKLSNADTVIKEGAVASGAYSAIYTASNTDAPINSMAAGEGSLTMFRPSATALSSTTSSGATSYSFSSNAKLLDGDLNYIKSLYFFTKNTPSSTGALHPSTVSQSNSNVITLTFSSSLNPTASVSYIYSGAYNVGAGSVAVGGGIATTQNTSGNLLIGERLVNSNFYSLQVGQSQNNSGGGSGLIGVRLKNSATGSLLAGNNLLNAKNYSALLGQGHDSTNGIAGVAAVGNYSVIDSNTAFAVGVGTASDARSNAFEVHADGRATIKTAPSANMDVANKKYVDDAVAGASGGVSDVTVNGSSVVSGGIANITGDLTDTKNTAGSTDTSSKIFLVGATTQAANPQTYSDNQVYATNGQLDANKVRVAETATIQWNSTDSSLDFVFA